MLGIGGTELLIILLFAFLIFGPDQLPKIGRTIGRAMRQFRNAQDEMNRVIKSEVYDPDNDDDPLNNPLKNIFDPDKDKPTQQEEKSAPTQNTETFAERKARLARERATGSDNAAATVSKTPEQAKSQGPGDSTAVDIAAPSAASSVANSLYGLGEED